jgi:hypothetical protein
MPRVTDISRALSPRCHPTRLANFFFPRACENARASPASYLLPETCKFMHRGIGGGGEGNQSGDAVFLSSGLANFGGRGFSRGMPARGFH